jgi:anti-sigma factor RsiW
VSHVDDCEKFVRFLSEYFDGELDGELEAEFMLHYEHCDRARALVRTFERTIVLHKQARRKTLPKDIHERLMDALRECERGER